MSFVTVAVGAFSSIQQGRLAKEQGRAQQAMLDYQAQVEQDNAMKLAAIIRRAGRRQVGASVAGYAGAGARVGEGSAALVEREITEAVEQDAFQALLEGGRRASGLQVEGAGAAAAGRAAQAAGYAGAINTALTGGYSAMRASGWRTKGPGFSGQQMPAPVESRTVGFDTPRPGSY